jgi:hypothetical protein
MHDPRAGPARADLAPADYCDPVIEAYKKDLDRMLLRENLKLTVEERIRKVERFHASIDGWREAGRKSRRRLPNYKRCFLRKGTGRSPHPE